MGRKRAKRAYKHWSRDEIVERIRGMAARRIALNARAVIQRCSALQQAACRHFGCWDAALKAAGFDCSRIRLTRHWDRKSVIARIRARHRAGLPLGSTPVDKTESALTYAARQIFGRWRRAVEAAGYDYSRILGRRTWTRRTVVLELQRRARAGVNLGASVQLRSVDSGLHAAAFKRFGSWRAAIKATGLDFSRVRRRRYWSPDRVIALIRARRRAGEPLNIKAVEKAHGTLVTQAFDHFGSWRKAIEAAGLDYSRIKKHKEWSKPVIVSELRRLHDAGVNLSTTIEARAKHRKLIAAVYRYFGNWPAALRAAGLGRLYHQAAPRP
jgi:hypothetical protein